jgi:hypothetical protein
LAVRHFVSAAMDAGIQIKESKDSVHGSRASNLNSSSNLKQSANNLTKKSSDMQLSTLSKDPSFVADDKGSSDVEIISSLDTFSSSIRQAVDGLVKIVEQDQNRRPAPNVFSMETRAIVSEVGRLLAYLEEIRLENMFNHLHDDSEFEDTLNDYRLSKIALRNNIAGLISSVTMAADPFAPPYAIKQVLLNTTVVLKSVKDLNVATKMIIEKKETKEQESLAQEVNAQLTSNSATVDDFLIPPRRAMSLSFLGGSADQSRQRQNVPPNQNSADRSDGSLENMTSSNEIMNSQTTTSSSTGVNRSMTTKSDKALPIRPDRRSVLAPSPATPSPAAMRANRSTGSHNVISSTALSSQARNRSSMVSPANIPKAVSEVEGESLKSPVKQIDQVLATEERQRANSSTDVKLRKFFGEAPAADSPKLRKFFGEAPPSPDQSSGRRRGNKHWYLDPDYKASDILFNMDGDQKVKAGTLPALIERLTMHDSPSKTTFFALNACRSFRILNCRRF